MNKRDELRKATLGSSPEFQKKLIKVNGKEFEIRQPSVRLRSEISKKAEGKDADGQPTYDMNEFLIWGVILCTYIPGTDETVYDAADYDMLVAMPSDSFLDELMDIFLKLGNVDPVKRKKK